MEKIEQLLLASGQGMVSVQASPDAQGTPEVWHEWLKDLRFLFKASVSRLSQRLPVLQKHDGSSGKS